MKRSPKTRHERMGADGNTPCDDCPSSEGMGPSDDGSSRLPLARRRFVDWLLSTSAGALVVSALYPVVRYAIPPRRAEAATGVVTLSTDPGEVASNSGRIFNFAGKPAILIRTPDGDLRAFSAVCTHLGCTVQYREDLQHIWCACHNGHFDLRGVNVAGPPPAPLEPYDVNVRGGTIIVSRNA